MNKPLYLFVGRSASGKTTVADILEQKYGFKQVNSYTTRPPRYDGEVGHVFVTEEEFKALENMVAYTFYDNNHYGTTAEQLDQCTIYVVDIPGVETLLEKYNTNRSIVIIFFDTTVHTRINRMLNRGNPNEFIISRLLQDEKDDWFKQLDRIVWHYNRIIGKNIEFHSVDANGNLDSVLEMVRYYMEDELW